MNILAVNGEIFTVGHILGKTKHKSVSRASDKERSLTTPQLADLSHIADLKSM